MSKARLNFNTFEWLTFDCYGTLIDWESGIIAALNPILFAHRVPASAEKVLDLYGELEAELESARRQYMTYRNVLASIVSGLGERLSFVPSPQETCSLANSLSSWKPFPDTVVALRALKQKYKLGIISNTDDDLFAETAKQLGVGFDEVVTAQQVRSYKPSVNNFQTALQRMRIPRERVLHVAQSVYHDIIPTRFLGITNVWVNRRGRKPGAGATKSARGKPDLEVQDLETLASLAL